MTVTWGQNTVHSIPGTPAPAPTFGSSPAPAGGGIFGTSSSTAPAASLFGSSPAPAPGGGGLFGTTSSTAPASGGIFSSPTTFSSFSSAAAPSSSLFGTPSSTSLFGQQPGSATSPFGAAPTTQQQQQIPAQAALQAHMDASARQEAEKIRLGLETLHCAYSGNVIQGSSGNESSKFVTITYNDMTSDQRQLQFLHGMGTGGNGHLMAPPKPPQVSESDWKEAVVKNPDPQNYMPNALVGAMALQARVSWQQDRAKELAANAASLTKTHELLKDRIARVNEDLIACAKTHAAVRKRLLDVMRRVEIARCMNQPM